MPRSSIRGERQRGRHLVSEETAGLPEWRPTLQLRQGIPSLLLAPISWVPLGGAPKLPTLPCGGPHLESLRPWLLRSSGPTPLSLRCVSPSSAHRQALPALPAQTPLPLPSELCPTQRLEGRSHQGLRAPSQPHLVGSPRSWWPVVTLLHLSAFLGLPTLFPILAALSTLSTGQFSTGF